MYTSMWGKYVVCVRDLCVLGVYTGCVRVYVRVLGPSIYECVFARACIYCVCMYMCACMCVLGACVCVYI